MKSKHSYLPGLIAVAAALAVSSPAAGQFVLPPLFSVPRIVGEPPLPPVTVEFLNTHREEVLVQLLNQGATGERPVEFRLRPGESCRKRLEREAGGFLELVLIDCFGQPVAVLDRQPIPPRSLYDVAVHEHKVVSVYYDRTLKGKAKYQPQEVNKGLRSIGVFPLPPGARLVEGSTIDVFEEASFQQNPGAVRALPRPRSVP